MDDLGESLDKKLLKKQTGRMVTKEAQHFVHQSRWFGVPKRAEVEKARGLLAFPQGKCTYEALLRHHTFTVGRRATDEVQEANRRLMVVGRNNVEVLGLICRDSAKAEVCLRLFEPDVRLQGPERWQFQGDHVLFRHEAVTTVAAVLHTPPRSKRQLLYHTYITFIHNGHDTSYLALVPV